MSSSEYLVVLVTSGRWEIVEKNMEYVWESVHLHPFQELESFSKYESMNLKYFEYFQF